jgi:hypothetical protein
MQRLSPTQEELLVAVCLKRYAVTYEGYMGSFRPYATVNVEDVLAKGPPMRYRATTVEALRNRGFVTIRTGFARDNSGPVRPTANGIAYYVGHLENESSKIIGRIRGRA